MTDYIFTCSFEIKYNSVEGYKVVDCDIDVEQKDVKRDVEIETHNLEINGRTYPIIILPIDD